LDEICPELLGSKALQSAPCCLVIRVPSTDVGESLERKQDRSSPTTSYIRLLLCIGHPREGLSHVRGQPLCCNQRQELRFRTCKQLCCTGSLFWQAFRTKHGLLPCKFELLASSIIMYALGIQTSRSVSQRPGLPPPGTILTSSEQHETHAHKKILDPVLRTHIHRT
jgi:hypothetical protein